MYLDNQQAAEPEATVETPVETPQVVPAEEQNTAYDPQMHTAPVEVDWEAECKKLRVELQAKDKRISELEAMMPDETYAKVNKGEQTGEVLKWMPHAKYGFIKPTDGTKNIFVPVSSLLENRQELLIGEKVSFCVEISRKNGNPIATKVKGNGEGTRVEKPDRTWGGRGRGRGGFRGRGRGRGYGGYGSWGGYGSQGYGGYSQGRGAWGQNYNQMY